MSKKLIALISPFIDKKHGTERCIAEQIEHLSKYYEFHIYSGSVEDLEGVKLFKRNTDSLIYWHKIPIIRGPQLIKYVWWFVINHIWRLRDYLVRGIKYDLKYSPGVNCIDANLVVVHHVFIEFYKCVKGGMRLLDNPIKSWLLIIHRHLYYNLIIMLEYFIYKNKRIILGAVSKKVQKLLKKYFNRESFVIYHGTDFMDLKEDARLQSYKEERMKLNINDSEFVILMVGNDWYEKGLPCLLKAMSLVRDLPLHLLIRGEDEEKKYLYIIKNLNLPHRITFLNPVSNIFELYAAADIYISPSLYDSFAMPPAEAMACGLPVVVSSKAGVSEIIDDGIDGFVLLDPMDFERLANIIKNLYYDPLMREQIGKAATKKAKIYTWQRNAEILKELIDDMISKQDKINPNRG